VSEVNHRIFLVAGEIFVFDEVTSKSLILKILSTLRGGYFLKS